MDKKNLYITTMEGLGDNIYTRPFIKILSKRYNVYLNTVLPKIYKDLDVKFIDPKKPTYRTQQKELIKNDVSYSELPEFYEEITCHYKGQDLLNDSIITTMYKQFDIPFSEKLEWDLPDYWDEFISNSNSVLIPRDKKIAIIRPATIRAEWEISTRNPNPNYISWCAKVLHESGYYVISIADLEPNKEWLADNINIDSADLKLHSGELGIYGTLELLKMADIIVGGVGFISPAGVSANRPLFTIFGGRQQYDCLQKIFHPSMDFGKLGWSIPDKPCRCTLMKHDCNKTISHLDSDFYNFLGKIQ